MFFEQEIEEITYSTAKRKLNQFLKDNDYRVAPPFGRVTSHKGYTFRYAKIEAFEAIDDFVKDELGFPSYIEVWVDEDQEGDYFVIISFDTGANP